MPILSIKEIWATEADSQVPIKGEAPIQTMEAVIALLGGIRFRMGYYPPDVLLGELAKKGEIDLAQVGAEFTAAMPDIVAVLEPDFMHTTDTIDYNIVLSGELWCEAVT